MSHQVTTSRSIPFDVAGDVELLFDLHVPEAVGPLPLAIYLHGGGWMRGTRADYEATRVLPVAASGIVVATVDYRLSGQATWPAQLDDVRSALATVPGLIADREVDLSGRVGLWGCSAGGHLALMAALTAAEDGAPEPDAVVAWFPTTDLTVMSDAPKSPRARLPHFMLEGSKIPPFERFLLGLHEGEDGVAALDGASPLSHVVATSTPILLVHGDEDALVPLWHSEQLQSALEAVGASTTTVIAHGAAHEDPRLDTPAFLGATAAHLRGAA